MMSPPKSRRRLSALDGHECSFQQSRAEQEIPAAGSCDARRCDEASRLMGVTGEVGCGINVRPSVENEARKPVMSDPTEAFVAHRNLLFTVAYEMLGSAADAEDVLQETWLRWAGRRPRHGPRPARVPGADHHPAGAQPAAHARPPQGVVRRPVAARAAADVARRGRGRRAGRQRLDGDAAGAGDADADRAGGVRAARGVRPRPTTRSPRPSARARRRSGRSRTGPGRTSRPAGRARSSPPAETRDALEAFQRAVETGDLRRLLDVLAPDVVLVGDGGGSRRPR